MSPPCATPVARPFERFLFVRTMSVICRRLITSDDYSSVPVDQYPSPDDPMTGSQRSTGLTKGRGKGHAMITRRITQTALAFAIAVAGIQVAAPAMANEGGGPPLSESRPAATKKAKKTFKQRGAERRAEQAAKKKAKAKAKAEAKKAKQTAKDKKRLNDARKSVAHLEKELEKLEKERKTKVWDKNSDVRKHLAKIKSVERNIKKYKRTVRTMKKKLGIKQPVRGVILLR
ncbi:hypothetical protein [uncultured Hoeflea sp.]|uniref:hypothetical protein n=1 Tax=uncultured Hoeflea sp. TaxID=538666 RepID=UPI0030EB3D79